MKYLIKTKFGYKEFNTFEEANKTNGIVSIKMTIDEYKKIAYSIDKLKKSNMGKLDKYKQKISKLESEIEYKLDIINNQERIIKKFKKELFRKNRNKNINDNEIIIKDTIFEMVKIEFITKKKAIQGIFKTQFDNKTNLVEIFKIIKLEIGKEIYPNYIFKEIDKIYLYNNNYWHILCILGNTHGGVKIL
ncbi:MAG: hypothetical protein ABF289_20830 [Clostridiales bacterium]